MEAVVLPRLTAGLLAGFLLAAGLAIGRAWDAHVLGTGTQEFRRVYRAVVAAAVVLGLGGLLLRIDSVRHWVFVVLPLCGLVLLAARFGVRVCPHAGGVGLCEAVQHLSMFDFVAVAETYLDTPYLWAGRTSFGIDCSGLVQTALEACGVAVPRDTDMQEKAIGEQVAFDGDIAGLARGDLVFWKGHYKRL